jgi:hypothetical protein
VAKTAVQYFKSKTNFGKFCLPVGVESVDQIQTQFQTEHMLKLAEKKSRSKSTKPAKKIAENLMELAKRKWPND